MDFNAAFELALGHEGGYVNDPNDPGGETKYGISKRSYPALDIKNLSLETAKRIYLHDFWGPAGCDLVPGPLKFHLFDFAINSGPRKAVETLQALLGVPDDGKWGMDTLSVLYFHDPRKLAFDLNEARLAYMKTLSTWPHHGKGWERRIRANQRLLK